MLKRIEVGEVDLIVSLFTEGIGLVSARARAARSSRRRFGGALEPFHTLGVRLSERAGHDLLALEEAELETVRHRLVQSLPKLEAAGHALAWIKRGAPARTPEPAVWASVTRLLDDLDGAEPGAENGKLAACGLRLLNAFGWGLELSHCVRCGRACGPRQAAMVNAARGGLVCKACGGASLTLSAPQRARLERAQRGDDSALENDDAGLALSLVEGTLDVHSGSARA